MNDDFVSLYEYDRWANGRMFGACRKLTAEQYVAEPAPGWSSVRATVTHIVVATEGWLRGMTGETVEHFPTEADLPTVDDAERHLEKGYTVLDGLRATLTPEYLATSRTFRSRGRSAVLPPWVVLRHVANHGTYHRGQVAAKLKRLGIEQPPTDFLFWAFEHFPQG